MVFENRDDGVFATTETSGAKTSIRWTVAADGEGSMVVEEFKLLSCWWGFGWFILWTTRVEHKGLFKLLEKRLNEG